MQVYSDRHGKVIRLGNQVGQGGEAAVYESLSDPSMVVKIYHHAPDQNQIDKLSALIELSRPEIVRFAAWPYSIVRKAKFERPIGFVMPRAHGKVIHNLYTPSSRKLDFPLADWRFLVRTACNFATAVETLHDRGIVIGDINQGNVLVSDDALVRFIDCDSFQIKRGNQTFRCPVGVPHFTPPELHSGTFSQSNRTQNHDRFGLAVIIFHLLFLGRHPFSGLYLGDPDLSLEDKIKEYRFAFGRNRKHLNMELPPNTLLLNELSGDIAELFERAFSSHSANDTRPTASVWRIALKQFESSLIECEEDPGHYFYSRIRCPWCRIVNGGGPNFFVSVSETRILDRFKDFDPDKVIGEIFSITVDLRTKLDYNPKKLVFDAELAKSKGQAASPETMLFIKVMIAACLSASFLLFVLRVTPGAFVFGIAAVFMSAILVFFITSNNRMKEKGEKYVSVEENRIKKLSSDFESRIRSAESLLRKEREQLIKLSRELSSLESNSRVFDSSTFGNTEQEMLERYLYNHKIRDAKIHGIGKARVATLMQKGIRNASDIDHSRIENIPGFRGAVLNSLMAWKSEKTKEFYANNSQRRSSGQRSNVDPDYIRKKVWLVKQLTQGVRMLKILQQEQLGLLRSFVRKERLD